MPSHRVMTCRLSDLARRRGGAIRGTIGIVGPRRRRKEPTGGSRISASEKKISRRWTRVRRSDRGRRISLRTQYLERHLRRRTGRIGRSFSESSPGPRVRRRSIQLQGERKREREISFLPFSLRLSSDQLFPICGLILFYYKSYVSYNC